MRQAVQYFAQTLDRTVLHWRIIPKTADDHPHAPWWNQEGREGAFDAFSLNPTAEILGYVLDYGEPGFEQGIVSQLMDRVLDKSKMDLGLQLGHGEIASQRPRPRQRQKGNGLES